MAKQQWRLVRPKQLKPKLPDTLKIEVQSRASQLVESVLKPAHVKPPADNERFNYIVDVYTKWSAYTVVALNNFLTHKESKNRPRFPFRAAILYIFRQIYGDFAYLHVQGY